MFATTNVALAAVTNLQTAYAGGNTIVTAGTVPIAFTLTAGNFNVSGAGQINFTPTSASQFTSGGALTFTAGAASTWSTTAGALTIDAGAALNLGTTNATGVNISKSGVTSTVNGALTVSQTFTTNGTVDLSAGVVKGASPLVFDGATANANKTTFAIVDPTAARTITFPNATITVNAAGDLSGTTLAASVVSSSLTSVGTLTGLTSTGNVDLTGATLAGASPLAFDGATADANKTTFAITNPTAARTITFPDVSGTVAVTASSPVVLSAAGDISCPTCVVPGSAPSFTGLTSTGTVTLTGATIAGASPFVFNGATVDANKTTVAITDPTASQTITFPDASGTVAVSASSPVVLSAAGDISCPTCLTSSAVTLQAAYNGGNTITTSGSTPVTVNLTSGDLNINGTGGEINVSTEKRIKLESTDDGFITIGNTTTFMASRQLLLESGSDRWLSLRGSDGWVTMGIGTNGIRNFTDFGTFGNQDLYLDAVRNVHVGGQQWDSSDKTMLVISRITSDPTIQLDNGALYYNTTDNKFRCYENSSWRNCDGTGQAASFTDLASTGNTTVGDASSDTLTVNARLASDLVPNTDDTYDLGSSSLRWHELHVGPGSVVVHDDATDDNKLTTDFASGVARIIASGSSNPALTIDTASALDLGPGSASQHIGQTGTTLTIDSDIVVNGTVTCAACGGGGGPSDMTVNDLDVLGNAYFGNDSSDYVQFNDTIHSNIVPTADDTYDLGSSSLRWHELHVGPGSVIVHNDLENDNKLTLDFAGAIARLTATGSAAPSLTVDAAGALALGPTADSVSIGKTGATVTIEGDIVLNGSVTCAACGGDGGGGSPSTGSLQDAYLAGGTITTTNGSQLNINLDSGNFYVSGAGGYYMNVTSDSMITSQGQLTLDGRTTLNLNTINHGAINAGNGMFTVGGTLQVNGGLKSLGAVTVDNSLSTQSLTIGTGGNGTLATITGHRSDVGTVGNGGESIAFGSCITDYIAVDGAASGDTVVATPPDTIEDGLVWSANATGGSVKVRLCNVGAPEGVVSNDQTWRADVWQHDAQPPQQILQLFQ